MEVALRRPVHFGCTDTYGAAAVDALPVESVVHAVENIEGPRIDPHKVSVPAPHRIRLLGVHPDRLWWYETGRKGEGWEGRRGDLGIFVI